MLPFQFNEHLLLISDSNELDKSSQPVTTLNYDD